MKKILTMILVVVMAFVAVTVGFAEEKVACTTSILMRTTGSVNVRADTDIEARVFCVMPKDSYINVHGFYPTADGRVWGKVDVYDGEYCYDGYISCKYLEVVYDEGFNYKFEFSDWMRVTGGSVNARAYGNINAPVEKIIHSGDIVNVVELVPTDDGRMWANCYSIEGKYIGWVSMRYLEVYEHYQYQEQEQVIVWG